MVITADQARAQGITYESLLAVAKWNGDMANKTEKDKDGTAHQRYAEQAKTLRAVADEI